MFQLHILTGYNYLFNVINHKHVVEINTNKNIYIFVFHGDLFSVHSIMVFTYHAYPYIDWLIVNILHEIENVRLLIFLVISQNSKYCILSLQYLEYFIFYISKDVYHSIKYKLGTSNLVQHASGTTYLYDVISMLLKKNIAKLKMVFCNKLLVYVRSLIKSM